MSYFDDMEAGVPGHRQVTGYRLTVRRGEHAGMVKTYKSRHLARRVADKLDLEYGAICASVSPIWSDSIVPAKACKGCGGYHSTVTGCA